MARRYYVRSLPPAGPVTLPDDVGHHLGRVVRCRPGDAVVLFDGRGHEALARIVGLDRGRGRVDAEVSPQLEAPAGCEPDAAVHVAFALPAQGSRADWLFEHGCEVGVRSFRPLSTGRAPVRRRPIRNQRWERIVQAASGQCDRALVPTIEPAVTVAELCALDLPTERYVALPGASELARAQSAAAIVVVGPAGGLTKDEVAQLAAAGFEPRGLGPLTLRTETAVLVAAARLLQ